MPSLLHIHHSYFCLSVRFQFMTLYNLHLSVFNQPCLQLFRNTYLSLISQNRFQFTQLEVFLLYLSSFITYVIQYRSIFYLTVIFNLGYWSLQLLSNFKNHALQININLKMLNFIKFIPIFATHN